MNKRMKKAIQDSFRFPETKHKNEFLMQAEVISAQEEQRKKRYPIVFRVSAAAAAGVMALGLWSHLGSRSKLSENDFRDEPAIVTGTIGNGESQPVTTAIWNGETANVTTDVSAASSLNSTAAKTTTVTAARSAFTALGAGTQRTTASRSDHSSRTTANTNSNSNKKNNTSTTEHTITNEEKTYYMNQLGTFASAFVMGGNAIPMASDVEYIVPYTRMYTNEETIFADIESNKDIVDINDDGVFDMYDCYDIYCYSNFYEVPEQVKDKCTAYGVPQNDLSDNSVQWLSYKELIRYLLVSEGARSELFTADNYPDRSFANNAHGGSSSDGFISQLYSESSYLMAGYPLISEAYKNNSIDLDVNADGFFDINDYIEYIVYSTNVTRSKQDSSDADLWARPEITTQRCEELSEKAKEITHDKWLESYFVWCLLETTPFRMEYTDPAFYKSVIPDKYSKYYRPERYFEEYCEATGIKEYLFTFSAQKFNSYFDEYCKDVDAGRRSAPDINLDGVIDRKDYEASDIYFGDILNGRNSSKSELPTRVWNNITTNCDFNNNGTSGDVYDIMITQMFVLINNSELDEARSGSSYNYDSNMGILIDTDIPRSGDVNGDGEVDMADAVLIMQFLADPDKYQLTDSAKFNADVDGGCNGINSNDASAIQRLLLNL